jgi:hypothetical protein
MKSLHRNSILTLFAAFALAASGFAQTADTSKGEHFTRSFAVNPGSTLDVENYKGAIHVTAASGNQFVLNVYKKFEGSDGDRKWWMANTNVSFDNDPNRVRVGVQYPNTHCVLDCNDHSDYTAWVELTIQVPQRINLDLNGYKPDMKISGTEGGIRIHSYKSPIEIESTTGEVSIATYKETVRLRDVRLRGPFDLSMDKGEATIEAKEIGGDLDIKTDKGSVILRVPRDTGLTVDYSGGRRANFHSDLPLTSQAGFHSDEVNGALNGGGKRLRLRTDKGSISIEPLP